jgi:hypothetical protein
VALQEPEVPLCIQQQLSGGQEVWSICSHVTVPPHAEAE